MKSFITLFSHQHISLSLSISISLCACASHVSIYTEQIFSISVCYFFFFFFVQSHKTYCPSNEAGCLISYFCTSVKLVKSRSHSVTSGFKVPGVGKRILCASGNEPLLVRPPVKYEFVRTKKKKNNTQK